MYVIFHTNIRSIRSNNQWSVESNTFERLFKITPNLVLLWNASDNAENHMFFEISIGLKII